MPRLQQAYLAKLAVLLQVLLLCCCKHLHSLHTSIKPAGHFRDHRVGQESAAPEEVHNCDEEVGHDELHAHQPVAGAIVGDEIPAV